MSDKAKIVAIYVGAALLLVAVTLMSLFVRIGRDAKEKREMELRIAKNVGRERAAEMVRLEKDLVAVNQAGEEVRLSELKDKVWLAAQFFAECPMCAQRNGDHLARFYEKYRDNPDFHIVCVSVDPENDDPEKLSEVAKVLNADVSNWWFLTGDRETLHNYMTEEMKFLSVRERTDPVEIDAKGRFAHDMGVAVFGKGMVMKEKKDLFFAREQGGHLYEHYEKLLTDALEEALEEGGDE